MTSVPYEPPPIPANDGVRVDALRRLGVLDTEPEERFDRFVHMAQALLDVPIALVSLVDTDRQWFKSKVGLDECETSREISFCGHAVAANDLLVVRDTRLDVRFRENPLVVGAPFIRFYAGAVLRARAGEPVGTVCAIDYVPRSFEAADEVCLLEVAHFVQDELHRNV